MKYNFKDILIGLRQEYILIREKLDKIKKDIKLIDNELSKCNVLLNNDNNMISIYFHEKEKEIITAIINVEKEFGIPLYHLENLTYDSDLSFVYHFKNNIKHYHIIIENIEEFNNKILYVLNSSFISMMKKDKIETIYNNKPYTLNLDYNHLGQEINKKSNDLSEIDYYPNKDLIKLSYLGILSNDILNNNLKVEYNSNSFNDYQKNLIEKESKDIVLFDDKTYTKEFKIEEEEKRLVLVKR